MFLFNINTVGGKGIVHSRYWSRGVPKDPNSEKPVYKHVKAKQQSQDILRFVRQRKNWF